MERGESIWEFETKHVLIRVSAISEDDLDLSFDDDGSIRQGLESGKYIAFCARAQCFINGHEMGCDYLGGCIYETTDAFRDHLGCKAGGYGSYFSDMVRECIREARKNMGKIHDIKLRVMQ